MRKDTVWDNYPPEIDEIIAHMVRDKVEIAPYDGLYIIDAATKEAARVKESNKEFSVIKSPQGEYVTINQNSWRILQALPAA